MGSKNYLDRSRLTKLIAKAKDLSKSEKEDILHTDYLHRIQVKATSSALQLFQTYLYDTYVIDGAILPTDHLHTALIKAEDALKKSGNFKKFS